MDDVSRTRVDQETVDLTIYVSGARSKRRAVVLEKHKAAPSDIDWHGIETELTEAINLTNKGEVGTLTIRGVHAASTDIVGLDLPDDVLVQGAYIDLPSIRSFVPRKDREQSTDSLREGDGR